MTHSRSPMRALINVAAILKIRVFGLDRVSVGHGEAHVIPFLAGNRQLRVS